MANEHLFVYALTMDSPTTLMKRCSSCGEMKPLDAFNRRSTAKDGRQWNCRACNAQWHAEHKSSHNQMIAARNRRIAEDINRKLFEYKLERGCADCGERDPTVLEFDHVDGKTQAVSTMARYALRWPRILLELERCDVVCANCHRRRTSRRANDIRWRLFLEHEERVRAVGRPRFELGTTTG